LPVDSPLEHITAALQLLEEGLASAKVRLLALSSTALFPQEFNELVAQTDSKGEALSLTTLRLVERMLDLLPERGAVQVTCDKHGGRDYYAALLQHVFPDTLLSVRREGRDESVYRITHRGRQVEIYFMAKGERLLPTALASMLAKYLRELAMKPFNEFWQRHIPGLRATAGYPDDSRRFHGEIAATQKQLGIANEVLWRCR
jgi:ribonuclease HIII